MERAGTYVVVQICVGDGHPLASVSHVKETIVVVLVVGLIRG